MAVCPVFGTALDCPLALPHPRSERARSGPRDLHPEQKPGPYLCASLIDAAAWLGDSRVGQTIKRRKRRTRALSSVRPSYAAVDGGLHSYHICEGCEQASDLLKLVWLRFAKCDRHMSAERVASCTITPFERSRCLRIERGSGRESDEAPQSGTVARGFCAELVLAKWAPSSHLSVSASRPVLPDLTGRSAGMLGMIRYCTEQSCRTCRIILSARDPIHKHWSIPAA